MVNLIQAFSKLRNEKALVIGDFMLDTYTIGKASRISPEAPVPIMQVKSEKSLPGGAGNVALNLVSMGLSVSVLGRVGPDRSGQELIHLLNLEGIDTSGLTAETGYMTPVKNRIVADNQQMIRIDHEHIAPLTAKLEEEILSTLSLEGIKVIAISDYGKGFLSRKLLAHIIASANKLGIPVIVDPKGADFSKYKYATLIKPNAKEAYAAANLPFESPLDEVAEKLLKISECQNLMITRSEAGISLFDRFSRSDFPVEVKEVKDVTGAGDTVLALITVSLASGLALDEAASLANIAASLAVEHVGCARITLQDLAARLFASHSQNKIFDEKHFDTFSQMMPHYAVLELAEQNHLDSDLYKKIQALQVKGPVIIKLSPAHDPHFPHLLSSLKEVSYVFVGTS